MPLFRDRTWVCTCAHTHTHVHTPMATYRHPRRAVGGGGAAGGGGFRWTYCIYCTRNHPSSCASIWSGRAIPDPAAINGPSHGVLVVTGFRVHSCNDAAAHAHRTRPPCPPLRLVLKQVANASGTAARINALEAAKDAEISTLRAAMAEQDRAAVAAMAALRADVQQVCRGLVAELSSALSESPTHTPPTPPPPPPSPPPPTTAPVAAPYPMPRCDSAHQIGFRGWECDGTCFGDPDNINTCEAVVGVLAASQPRCICATDTTGGPTPPPTVEQLGLVDPATGVFPVVHASETTAPRSLEAKHARPLTCSSVVSVCLVTLQGPVR